MKTLKNTLLALFLMAGATTLQAQTADEIIEAYFENTGGKANWEKIETLKYSGVANAQGMEIPWVMVMTKDGKQALTIDLQGQKMTQFAFDGNEMWTTNFMTMQPEKADAEASANMKKSSAKDFISPFLNYKEKGYSVELIGEETIEGTEAFKIKLTQDPVMVDGVETPAVSFHYFEKENMVPIVSESEIQQGPAKGQMSTNTMSDYEEVDGLFFPFSMTQGGQGMTVKSIEINADIDESIFAYPATEAETDEKKN